MEKLKGVIVARKGQQAKVKLTQPGPAAYLDCWNSIRALPGDLVNIEYRSFDEKKSRLIMICFPLFAGVGGAVFGKTSAQYFHWQGQAVLQAMGGGALLWLLLGVVFVWSYKHDALDYGELPVIIRVEKSKYQLELDGGKAISKSYPPVKGDLE